MKIYNRAYDDSKNDFKKLWDFFIEDYKARQYFNIYTLGRITDWKYGLWIEKKFMPDFHKKNAQLWLNYFDELVGFVICENGNNYFTPFVKKNYEHLYPKMIEWAILNLKDRGDSLFTDVNERNAEIMSLFETYGFKNEGVEATSRKYDLQNREDKIIQLPDGYRIVDMIENNDFTGKKRMQKSAFRNDNNVREFDLAAYEIHRNSPIYNPYYDLSVIDENGKHISGCIPYVDYENSYAEVEVVCTDPDYQKKGYGEAVILESFRRMKKEGIKYAYISGYSEAANKLYQKLGPVDIFHTIGFRYKF